MPKPQANEIDKYIGKKLRGLRGRNSAAKVAEEIGITQQQLSRYELGVNKINAGLLYHIARHFDRPISTFFEGYEEKVPVKQKLVKVRKAISYSPATDKDQLTILTKEWGRLKSEQKAIIMKILDSYLQN